MKKDAANAIEEKNKELLSLIKMQQKNIEMEVKELQEQNYEALYDSILDMQEKMVEVTTKMNKTDKTDDKENWDTMMRYKGHLKKKVTRARTKMAQLETVMKLDFAGKDVDESNSSSDSD